MMEGEDSQNLDLVSSCENSEFKFGQDTWNTSVGPW